MIKLKLWRSNSGQLMCLIDDSITQDEGTVMAAIERRLRARFGSKKVLTTVNLRDQMIDGVEDYAEV